MSEDTLPDEALPVNIAARYLRVPARWLRGEIDAGRVPGVRADRVLLVHPPTVARLLRDRAARSSPKRSGGGEK